MKTKQCALFHVPFLHPPLFLHIFEALLSYMHNTGQQTVRYILISKHTEKQAVHQKRRILQYFIYRYGPHRGTATLTINNISEQRTSPQLQQYLVCVPADPDSQYTPFFSNTEIIPKVNIVMYCKMP